MHKIHYYQNKFSSCNQFAQGSLEWYQNRKHSFGGSELASVLDGNKYKSFKQVCDDKKLITDSIDNLNDQFGNDNTCWGKLFEPISKHFIREKFGTIFEFGSIPHPFVPVSYSPDGIILNKDKTDIVLLEIKNPIKRSIMKNNKPNIPDIYLPQVQTGLNVFNCEFCVFAQFRFRRCKMTDDSKNMSFDRMYHLDFCKRSQYKPPIAFGYLYWPVSTSELIDLSKFPNMIEKLQEVIKFPCDLFNPKVFLNQEIDLKDYKTGFILKWKLFDINYEKIVADKTFLFRNQETLWKKYKTMIES